LEEDFGSHSYSILPEAITQDSLRACLASLNGQCVVLNIMWLPDAFTARLRLWASDASCQLFVIRSSECFITDGCFRIKDDGIHFKWTRCISCRCCQSVYRSQFNDIVRNNGKRCRFNGRPLFLGAWDEQAISRGQETGLDFYHNSVLIPCTHRENLEGDNVIPDKDYHSPRFNNDRDRNSLNPEVPNLVARVIPAGSSAGAFQSCCDMHSPSPEYQAALGNCHEHGGFEFHPPNYYKIGWKRWIWSCDKFLYHTGVPMHVEFQNLIAPKSKDRNQPQALEGEVFEVLRDFKLSHWCDGGF